jgi:hypothetical protein
MDFLPISDFSLHNEKVKQIEYFVVDYIPVMKHFSMLKDYSLED